MESQHNFYRPPKKLHLTSFWFVCLSVCLFVCLLICSLFSGYYYAVGNPHPFIIIIILGALDVTEGVGAAFGIPHVPELWEEVSRGHHRNRSASYRSRSGSHRSQSGSHVNRSGNFASYAHKNAGVSYRHFNLASVYTFTRYM